MAETTAVLVAVALAAGAGTLATGPWLARLTVRLASREDARPSRSRTAVTAGLAAVGVAGAVLVAGLRPAAVAFTWAAGSAVVLGAVDLLAHRLPDRVLAPTVAVCAVALLADAAVLGTWPALLRAVLGAAAAFGLAALGALISPQGLGFGDVKLLGLLGLLLGWVAWEVLAVGIFLGLLAGALVSLALVAARRAGWRSAVPFGPPLLVGAALALAAAPSLPA